MTHLDRLDYMIAAIGAFLIVMCVHDIWRNRRNK